MNSKKIIIATFSLLLSALLIMGTINVVIDPLFQYHKPWFGLEAYIIDERYQNAGVAKNFDFENVVIGNSMTENFLVSDVEKTFNGKTVKLSASGSYVLDWTYLLNILNRREKQPEHILMNLDPGIFDYSDKTLLHEMPVYLYDNNYFNDIEYIFNFKLTQKYTLGTLRANKSKTVPDYNMVFVWYNESDFGKDVLLEKYEATGQNDNPNEKFCYYTEDNLELLRGYFEAMNETQFVFFCSPYSVLYWKEKCDLGLLEEYKKQYERTFSFMSQFQNVSIYFWTDEEMLRIISDLDNYKDPKHYGIHINKEMLKRIEQNVGELPKNKSEWQPLLDGYFDYLENFDYDKLFE